MKIARTAVSAASHNGVLYAVGGECAQHLQDDTIYLRSLETYDPIVKVRKGDTNVFWLRREYVV